MTSDRATIRPVTLARLVEVTHLSASSGQTTGDIEDELDVSRRRARETLLEALRLGLISEDDPDADEPRHEVTTIGEEFLEAVSDERWTAVSDVLREQSPHYGTFLDALAEVDPIRQDDLLERLDEESSLTPFSFNATGIDVVADWAERLQEINRDAFTGACYLVRRDDVPDDFPDVLLSVFDDLESSAGVNLRQRYLSIPELREEVCKRLRCTRAAFDEAVVDLAAQNVGKLELSGAPVDTGAKEARYGIKEISLSSEDGLVSTSQSSEAVMAGVEQFDKQYYYLAVHDRDIAFDH